MNSARLDQLIDELVVNHHGAPVIGASLVPLMLRAQGIEVVPCLQGGQIMPTIDRVSRLLKQVFFKTEQGLRSRCWEWRRPAGGRTSAS